MIEIRTRGVKRTTAKFRQISATLRGDHAGKIADRGYRFALKIIPVYEGAMRKKLQKIKSKKSAKLRLNQPVPRDGRNRPYHLWMHGLGRYNTAHHITSGDPHFMFTTRDYMAKELKKEISKAVKNKKK